ncbi:Aldo/keto reductase [Byssothecium circinans]|uniref:Aldo/keto reductase n=1 Tax=Byssothecium circinans TaxID=147558 RepID=A0A6A5TQJ9_9PLEO|nr:Aldo/keto reductase [Byssothecium circinans]
MATVKLASGHQMPLVGVGLWKVPEAYAADTVYNAIKTGYRLFDGAYDYENENEAGEGIKRSIADGLVKRYIDLFLIRFPCALEYVDPAKNAYPGWWLEGGKTAAPARVPIRETWEQVEALVDQGIAKSIGVSNFQARSLYDIFTYKKHPISSPQIEHHPYLVQPELIKMANTHNITVIAYSSFGPQSFLELPQDFNETALLFDAEPVKGIARKHGKSPSKVLLRWATQRNIAVIPKSSNIQRLTQNLDVTSFDLGKEDLDELSGLDMGLRLNDPGRYLLEPPLHIFA